MLKELEIMYQNAIYTISLDMAKFADLQWKNVYVNRTQGVCHVIYIFIFL